MPGGRPSKYTPELGDRICEHLREGQSISCAAHLEGINPSTLHDWVSQGRDGVEAFEEFSKNFDRARAKAEAEAVRDVKKAHTTGFQESGGPDWRARMAWLSKARREEWGDKSSVELTGKDGAPLGKATTTDILQALREAGYAIAEMAAPFVSPPALTGATIPAPAPTTETSDEPQATTTSEGSDEP